MKTLTIFTPTFNRAHTIIRTYESLCRQSCKDFCWLVVDDGSTDNTRELVNGWIAEGNMPIQYVWKENGGLHTGYNKAISIIDTELTMCIDSDDWLVDDAVEKILLFWNQHRGDNCAGIVALDCYEGGNPIGGRFPEELCSTHIVQMSKYHRGDVKMIHRTSLLKPFVPMPSFEGERFANPIYIFLQVDKTLPLLVLNDNICVVEYQDANDSMSRNIWYQYKQSPRSFANLRILVMGHPKASLWLRFRYAIHFVSSCLLAKDISMFKRSPSYMMTILAIPAGLFLFGVVLYKNKKKTNYR